MVVLLYKDEKMLFVPASIGSGYPTLDVGMLFPCSFDIYEEGEKVWAGPVSIIRIAPEIGLASRDKLEPVINMTGSHLRSVWEKLSHSPD